MSDLPSGQTIVAALEDVARHLEANDTAAAATAIDGLGAACRAAAGVKLDPATLSGLRARLERCEALAVRSQNDLLNTLLLLGVGSRAHRAYQQGDR
jgi:hypothetical protein